MADDRAVLSVESSETQQANKFFDAAIKGIQGVKSVLGDFGKDGNIVTQMYGDQKQSQETFALQEKLNKQLDAKTMTLERLTKKMQEYWRTGDDKKWKLVRDRIGEVSGEIDELNQQLQQGAELMGQLVDQSEGLEDVDMEGGMAASDKLGSFSMLARQVGGQGENPFAETVDQIQGISESFGRFNETLGDFKGIMWESIKTGAQGQKGIKAFTGALSGGLTGLKDGAGAAVTALGPAGLALGGVAIAGGVLSSIMAEQNRQTQKEIELRRMNIDKQLEFNELVTNGTSDQLAASKAALEAELKIKEAGRDAALNAEVASDTLQSGIDKWRTAGEYALNRLIGRSGDLTTVYGQNIDDARELNTEITSIQNKLDNIARAEALVKKREEEEKAAERLANAEEEHLTLMNDLAKAQQDYTQQVKDFLDDQEFSRKRELEDEAIAAKRAKAERDAELLGMENDYNAAVISAKEESNRTLKSLDEEKIKAEEEAKEALIESFKEIETELNEARAENLAAYLKSEAEELESHNREVAKADEAFAKERVRRIKDAGKSMLDAELANDVNAYIAAQEQAKEDLDRMDEDEANRKKEEDENWQLARAQTKKQFEEQQADLETNAVKQRQQLQEQYDKENILRQEQYNEQVEAEKVALAEKLDAEKKSYEESLAANIAAFEARQKLEKEDRDLAERRRKEDLQRQLDQMDKAFQDQLTAIKENDQKVLDVIEANGFVLEETYEERERNVRDIVKSSYATLITQLKSMQGSMMWSSSGKSGGSSSGSGSPSSFDSSYPSIYNPSSKPGWGSSSGTSTGKFGKRAILAAEGAIVGPHKPTLVVAGEGDKQELVMPLDRSKGIPDGFFDSMSKPVEVHYHGNISIGDGVSESVFRQEMRTLAEGLFKGWKMAQNPGGNQ